MSKVLSALGGALPDDRPLLSLLIAESVAKCPTGYWPVSRTYDEDSDAGLMKQNGLFGKKPSHYICLSKSEGVPGYVMDGIVVVGEREPAPAGFSVAGRAGKRRLCTRVSRAVTAPATAAATPVTDVIVCSKMRQAPQGFIMAGEINGKVVCYKLSGGSAEASPARNVPLAPVDYENVIRATPDAGRSLHPMNLYRELKLCWRGNDRIRAAPERPPKLSPLINELGQLGLKSPGYPNLEEFTTEHDYEALSPSYAIKPSRPAPRPPPTQPKHSSPLAAGGVKRAAPQPQSYQTLGGYCAMDGVPFLLSPKLRGLPGDHLTQLPVIKARTKFELERDYSYSFTVERET